MTSFHQSLRASVVAGTKLDLGLVHPQASGDLPSLGGVATIAKINALESATTTAENLPDGYLTALRIFEQTGRIDLALDSLSLRRTVASELSRVLRPAWFYLALLLALATVGMIVFAAYSAPKVATMRADMALTPRVTVSEAWISLSQLQSLFLVLPLLAGGLIGLGFSVNASARLAMLVGGRQYLEDRRRQLKAIVEHATPDDSSSVDNSPRQSRLQLLSENYGFRASSRLSRMRIGLPALMIAVIGGSGVLVYCLLLFGPLISLMRDMTTVAVDAGVWP
jgi:hypothetical protein